MLLKVGLGEGTSPQRVVDLSFDLEIELVAEQHQPCRNLLDGLGRLALPRSPSSSEHLAPSRPYPSPGSRTRLSASQRTELQHQRIGRATDQCMRGGSETRRPGTPSEARPSGSVSAAVGRRVKRARGSGRVRLARSDQRRRYPLRLERRSGAVAERSNRQFAVVSPNDATEIRRANLVRIPRQD